jgi:hypothetical protein
MLADVQSWETDPASNNGWMLIAFSEDVRYTARRFGSTEDPNFAPLLSVTFQVVPEPSSVLLGALSLGLVLALRSRLRIKPRPSKPLRLHVLEPWR